MRGVHDDGVLDRAWRWRGPQDGRSPTLQAVTGEEIGPIWRKAGLSASDKRRVEKLYKCDRKYRYRYTQRKTCLIQA